MQPSEPREVEYNKARLLFGQTYSAYHTICFHFISLFSDYFYIFCHAPTWHEYISLPACFTHSYTQHVYASTVTLTVGRHPHGDALLEATFLALVPGHFVDDALPLVLTGVGRVEILLDGPPEETLESGHARKKTRSLLRKKGLDWTGLRPLTLQPSQVIQR